MPKGIANKNRDDPVEPFSMPEEDSDFAASKPVLTPFSTAVLALVAGALSFVVGVGATFPIKSADAASSSSISESFVGSQACGACHQAETRLWQTSHHRHAMEIATEQSVRGDFNDAVFDYAGTRSRFFRRDQKFLVETDGPDGKLATFEVKYTFGLDPLQQYLIEFSDGRIQALTIAWDARPKEQGGQRWFHLYPNGAIRHDDTLHWTRLNQNWNYMCAECHSTDVRKNYDAEKDRFATTFAEISVGCEACHGRGSRHVEWATKGKSSSIPDKGLTVRFDERAAVSWSAESNTLIPKRSGPPALLRKEVETCGLCHARRGQFSEGAEPGRWLSETHRVTLFDRQFFEADGQMRNEEEVYNYAPFKLSKMYAAGVTCSDCHDPHSAKLKARIDDVCGQCHAPAKYANETHQRHSGSSAELTCASCHMPVRTYMIVDRRHDHSFRIPRPDLTMQHGTPNACNDCHADKTAAWAAGKVSDWFGPQRRGYQAFGGAFKAAWAGQPDAQALLSVLATASDVSAFARASALAELPEPNLDLARRDLGDPDPLVRIGALAMLERGRSERLWPLVSPRLSDEVRGVRIRAAALLASVPPANRPAADADAFARAAADFVSAQRLNADRPEERTNLGNFYARQGNSAEAEAEYRAAMKLDSSFSPAAINLADLFRQLGRDGDGERVLRDALSRSGNDSALHHAVGLLLIRQKKLDAGLDELRQAATLAPEQPRYVYVYAIGLQSTGRRDDALAVLKQNLRRHGNHRESLAAALNLSYEKGDRAEALEYAQRLARQVPGDRGLADLIRRLQSRDPN